MADRRYLTVVGTAVVVAAGAAFGVWRSLERVREEGQVKTAAVIVAAQDIVDGARVDRMAVSVEQWPIAAIPAGAYVSLDSVVSRVTRVPIFKGEPMLPGRLAPVGTGPGLEVKISPGKRAMAVRINDVAGVAGLIQPNSRVDVLVTLKDQRNPGSDQEQRAKLFMENMRVLSVGAEVERGPDGKPINATTATLEVTPEESERLAVAVNQGTIQLVLRGYGESDSVKTLGASSADVMRQFGYRPVEPPAPVVRRVTTPRAVAPVAVAPAPPPPPRRPDSVVVQVFRGEKVTQQKIARQDTVARPDSAGPPN
jgi:pilus assembly protein CpaB